MKKVEQSQLVMKQFLLAMTINIAGLSAHSCIAMDKYINDNNKKVITISESHEKFQGFGNYDSYRISTAPIQTNLVAPCSCTNN